LPKIAKYFGLPNQNNNPKGRRDGVRELELGWEGRERDDDPFLKKKLSSLTSSKLNFFITTNWILSLRSRKGFKKKNLNLSSLRSTE
jgi:hypothetical protein